MQANFSDSNLFPQTEYNAASITPENDLNDGFRQNNSSLSNSSSIESNTTND